MKEIKKISTSELKIMNIFWSNETPLSISEIIVFLKNKDIDWAYRTVSTLIKRLETKDIIGSMKKGKAYYYYPLIEKCEFENYEAKKVITTRFSGSLVQFLSAFVRGGEKLTNEEIKELKDWFDDFDDK